MHPSMVARMTSRIAYAPENEGANGAGESAGGNITDAGGAPAFDFKKSIWDNNNAGGGETGAGGTNGNSQTGGSGGNGNGNSDSSGAGDPVAKMNAHIAAKNFSNGVDFQKLADGGDAEAIKSSFDSFARNMFVGMMSDVNSLVNARVEQAVEKAVKTTKSEVFGTQAVDEMFRALPRLNNPNTAPVAQSVFAQFIKQGQSKEMAIRSTDAYFKEMAQNILGVSGSSGRPNGSPRGGGNAGMSGNGNVAGANQPDDWMSFLSQ